jgi:hypothetical protein
VTSEQAVKWAEEHLFDRRSVVHEHELWRHALEHARGQNVSPSEIQAVTQQLDYVRDKQFHGRVTTREAPMRPILSAPRMLLRQLFQDLRIFLLG